jgi:hypothetical protein
MPKKQPTRVPTKWAIIKDILRRVWQEVCDDIHPHVKSNVECCDVLLDRAYDRVTQEERELLHGLTGAQVARHLKLY